MQMFEDEENEDVLVLTVSACVSPTTHRHAS